MNKKNSRPLKITLVTPNYNGERFLEETIISVVSQNYPNLEYIFVDGGSSDGSMQIVERYAQHFAHIICEPDEGHADALNKGFKLATGDVLAWINSDDLLLPNALHRVNRIFSQFPDITWLTGKPSTTGETGGVDSSHRLRTWSWIRFLCGDFRHIQQESTFWRRDLWQAAGAQLDTNYQLANDFELWLRFFQRAALHTIDAPLGCFRARSGQRSIAYAEEYEQECEQALNAFVNTMPVGLLARYFYLMPTSSLRSWRVKSDKLPPQLDKIEPAVIKMHHKIVKNSMISSYNKDIPANFQPDTKVAEDMIFDGFDRVIWHDGPQFGQYALAAVELQLVPFAPNVVAQGGMTEISPPTVALIGPLALLDWGNGRMTVVLRFRDGAVGHDLSLPEMGRSYRIKLLLSAERYSLFLDGRSIVVENIKGAQVMQAPFAVIGGGHAQRFWVGQVQQLMITVSMPAKAGKQHLAHHTYLLSHQSGAQVLPRQQNTQLPPMHSFPTQLSVRPSPLSIFRNRHRSERCFVMGNGPSLNKMDLEKLAGETVFACNSVFLLFERISWRPTYYTCVDTRVVRDRAAEITQMLDSHPDITAFFPNIVHLHDGSKAEFSGRDIIAPSTNRFYFNEVGNRETHHVETMFSLDADDFVVQPYTVAITMLQLATFMGFSEIYLIGCDTSYKVQKSVKQEGREINGIGLLLTSTADDDANHFDPCYFGQGREWHNPQVDKMINHYRWANLAVRRSKTKIFNATVGGQLEVFQRVDYNSLFLHTQPPQIPVVQRKVPLLSIAIPAYDRAESLLYALQIFIAQIEGKYENEIEIIVSDDCTPEDRLRSVRELAAQYRFLHYRRYETNLGLEKNLLACADSCVGEYLWIFGDDDFLETDTALERIFTILHEGRFDALVLNRTRRNTDLSTELSSNWMGLDPQLKREYAGLREFCLDFGFISVLGFISINIFRRRLFQRVDASSFMGTMYPQLGALLEAFHSRPTLLLGEPLVCHRTQTAEEKRKALGSKATESDFMADAQRRNALYFSHPYIAMLDELMRDGAFSPTDVMQIRENTVINGYLIDFLINCVQLNDQLPQSSATDEQWTQTAHFFAALPLDSTRQTRIQPILDKHINPTTGIQLTISVVTPSFNQAEFLPDCLQSVYDQTYPAIEHLIFDPGSTDGSRDIAKRFEHATLIAEPDKGQSDALNKGFARARGDIICWLNSDDQLADKEVFSRIIQRFMQPDAPDIVYGKGIYIDEVGNKLRDAYINQDPDSLHWRFAQEDGIMQPALFMRRTVIEKVGPLRNDLHFSMDYEYWIRCIKAGIRFVFIDLVLAVARYHISNKTYGQRGESYSEVCDMTKAHFGYAHHVWLKRYAEFLCDGHDGVLKHGENAGIGDQEKLELTYQELLLKYNSDRDTQNLLCTRQAERGYGETLHEMQIRGLLGASLNQQANTCLCGSFERLAKAHYDETDCVLQIYNTVLHGQVMIDVGAHFGYALAPFLGKGWEIFAFEPDEQNRQKLLQRLANHPYGSNVKLDTRAVSDKSQQGLTFYRSAESTGVSGLSAFLSSHTAAQTVDTVTLTEVLANENIDAVDFLKIDTEGHDLFVLKGFPWERFKPTVIECEFEDSKTVPLGYTFHDLANYLVDKGYTVYVSEWHPIIRYGIRHDWRQLSRYPCELADEKGWGNLLAFRDGIDEGKLVEAVHSVLKLGKPQPQVQAKKPISTTSLKTIISKDLLQPTLEPTIQFSRIAASESFVEISKNNWQYKVSTPQKQAFWSAVFMVQGNIQNKALMSHICLQASENTTVRVSLGRHGTEAYEGNHQAIKLNTGEKQKIQIDKIFSNNYSALKIQLEVLNIEKADSVDLIIDSFSIDALSISKIRQRTTDKSQINLANANILFRQGNYAAALDIYIMLYVERPLRIYADNALMCGRKLGLNSVKTLDELLQHI